MVLEKTLESPLDSKDIKPVNPKGVNPEYSPEGLMLELQYFCHLMQRLIGKDPDAKEKLRAGERGATEDEVVGWHHQLNGHEFEQTLGDSEGQGRLVCCNS